MGMFTTADAGRLAILAAVLIQAAAKVAYGTFLTAVPSSFFVLFSFALAAVFFLSVSRKGMGRPAWGALALLNVATAVAFLSFFFALKLVEPAIADAVNTGVGPLLAVAMAWVWTGQPPSVRRLAVCAGVLAGCAVLVAAAFRESGFAAEGGDARLGLAASACAGVGTVLVTTASRHLSGHGWSSGAILAHRFYVVLPVSLALVAGGDGIPAWSMATWLVLVAVALAGVLVPIYLLQFGIRRCEPYTVMVTMAAMPLVTFAVEGLSPAYRWSWTTACGLVLLTAFLVLDVARSRR